MNTPYDNRNRGVLFKNEEKQGENSPDYKGSINVDGKELWLSAWLKESKAGKKYMSLSVKPKLSSDRGSVPTGGRNDPRPPPADFDDDQQIPF